MKTPVVLLGKVMKLDDAIKQELKQHIASYCGQYGLVVLTEALRLAPVHDGHAHVAAQVTGQGMRVRIACESNKPDRLVELPWSLRAALVRRGAITITPTGSGTVIDVRVRLARDALSGLTGLAQKPSELVAAGSSAMAVA